jgi:hypothetical protein
MPGSLLRQIWKNRKFASRVETAEKKTANPQPETAGFKPECLDERTIPVLLGFPKRSRRLPFRSMIK